MRRRGRVFLGDFREARGKDRSPEVNYLEQDSYQDVSRDAGH